MIDVVAYNKDRWDRVAKKRGNAYTQPISHEELMAAKTQPLAVSLTVGKTVPQAWFDRMKGKKVLGLASGGGQQGPLFALHGYDVTIMDYSKEQLASDRLVAEREGLTIETVQADMTQPFPFENEAFDLVFCPVSNVYIEDLTNLWQECYRVLKPGGLLMVGYMNPWVYMYDGDVIWDKPEEEPLLTYPLPFNARELEEAGHLTINPDYGYEFSHTLDEQIGGQLRAGFAMIDFYESKNSQHRLSIYGSDYLANLSIKL